MYILYVLLGRDDWCSRVLQRLSAYVDVDCRHFEFATDQQLYLPLLADICDQILKFGYTLVPLLVQGQGRRRLYQKISGESRQSKEETIHKRKYVCMYKLISQAK